MIKASLEQVVLFAQFSGPTMYALRNDGGRFLLGSLGLREKKSLHTLTFPLTFHLFGSPPETFVSHPVFLANTRLAPPSGLPEGLSIKLVLLTEQMCAS